MVSEVVFACIHCTAQTAEWQERQPGFNVWLSSLQCYAFGFWKQLQFGPWPSITFGDVPYNLCLQ